jgi:putative ABC transport system substrate-binding protein
VWGTDVAEAAKRTTTTVPIVFALADRPDVLGLVSSLARPGSNLTGLTTLNFELTNKRLELLKEIIPGLTRVVVLSMHHPLVSVTVKEAEVPARSLGVRLQTTEIKGPDDLDGAFNRLAEDQPGALLSCRHVKLSTVLGRFLARSLTGCRQSGAKRWSPMQAD